MLKSLYVYREQEASLYEGLKRMTKGRLDDQRGLEINAELPEFLRYRSGMGGRGAIIQGCECCIHFCGSGFVKPVVFLNADPDPAAFLMDPA